MEIAVTGAFALRESAEFGFGQRDASRFDGVFRLAFCADGYDGQVGVAVRQPAAGVLDCEVDGAADEAVVAAQVARVLSVDVDATGYDALGRADPLVGRLQAARPGLRPPLFHSAYEAAALAVLSARRPLAEMALVRERLAAEHGRVFTVAGDPLAAFPTPDQLLRVREFPGLTETKIARLHAVADAARGGLLDTAALREATLAAATDTVRSLPGIGPFYAELITIRALGHTDVLPTQEPRVRKLAARLAGITEGQFETHAETWRPWRTWVTVALRAAGTRLDP